MRASCAEKVAVRPRKRLDYSTLQSIVDKESANRGQAARGGILVSSKPSAQGVSKEKPPQDNGPSPPRAHSRTSRAASSRCRRRLCSGGTATASRSGYP